MQLVAAGFAFSVISRSVGHVWVTMRNSRRFQRHKRPGQATILSRGTSALIMLMSLKMTETSWGPSLLQVQDLSGEGISDRSVAVGRGVLVDERSAWAGVPHPGHQLPSAGPGSGCERVPGVA